MIFNLAEEQSPSIHKPIRAIILYEGQNRTLLAIEHPIITKRSKPPRLGAGRFITTTFVNKLLEMVKSEPLQYIPEHVIAISRESIVWYEPAATRRMLFQTNDTSVNAFDNIEIPQPPLVFIASKQRLSVYALFDDRRPTMDTKLATAPYFNVSDGHSVCLGSMPTQTTNAKDTHLWTTAFFSSNFTHFSGSIKKWEHTGTYSELLQSAIDVGTFESAWLKNSKYTLENAICSS